MDDLKFRRQAYTDPECQDVNFIEHKKKSVENINFVDELQLMDDSLKKAMNIQPPEDLAERIKLNQTLGRHQFVRKRMIFWSMAASVLLVFSLFFTYQFVEMNRHSLDQLVLSHIYDELDHLYEKQNPSLNQINILLSDFDSHLNSSVGQVNYLGSCEIAKKKGVHMIVEGSIGPITVMMLPEIPVSSQHLINDKRFKGLIMPAGKGSVVVVGEKGEPLESLQEKLMQNIRWI